MLLDIHPLPDHARVEVGDGEAAVAVGQVDATAFIGKVVPAQAALAELVAAGYFAVEQVETFAYVTAFDGVAEWLDHIAAKWTSATVPPAVIERVRARLPDGRGPIQVREAAHAARLRRTGPPGGRGA